MLTNCRMVFIHGIFFFNEIRFMPVYSVFLKKKSSTSSKNFQARVDMEYHPWSGEES